MITRKIRSVSIPDEYWEKLRQHAKESNMSMSRYLCHLINLEIPKPVPPDAWARMYSELAEYGKKFNELYDLAKKNNSANYESFKGMSEEIHKLREEIVELGLGRWDLNASNRHQTD